MQKLEISNRVFWGNIDCFKNLRDINGCMPIESTLTIDLSNLCEVNPFNMLTLALSIKNLNKWFDKILFYHPSIKTDGYMQYMGFYEICGEAAREIKKGNQKLGRYICIREIKFTSCGSVEADYEMMELEAQRLSTMFQFDKDLAAYIKYCFFEMIRNTYEHAKAKSVYVCAQYWPTHNLVELAIVDEGQGVKRAMERKFKLTDEVEIMKYSMLPGISAQSNHTLLPRGDYYQNSGYGLYITKELALAYDGSFILCSGNCALRYYTERGQSVCNCYDTKYNGTAIAIRFNTQKSRDFYKLIATITQRGEKLSQQYGDAIHTASKSSGGNRRY